MLVLTAAVVLVGVLCLLDLLLTLAVTRRLREHTTRLQRVEGRRGAVDEDALSSGKLPAPGTPVGPFTATTVDGEPVSADSLADRAVAVFLAPECADCRKKVPELVSWAAGQERERVLVVVDGRGTDPADVVGPLNPVATVVVVETFERTVIDAFAVSAFPSFCVVADGKVTDASMDFSRLPTLPISVARA
jgi:thiol-disulfide isomerase/thioredoxin